MMRIVVGIVWFVVIFLVLYIIFSVIVGVIIFNSGHVADTQQQIQAVVDFTHEHAVILSLCRWSIVVTAVVAAAVGSWKRILPGTKRKNASANQ